MTVNGDRGTLHFECHYINVDTGEVAAVTAGDFDVARIDGRWLITNMVGSTAELRSEPGSEGHMHDQDGAAGGPSRGC